MKEVSSKNQPKKKIKDKDERLLKFLSSLGKKRFNLKNYSRKTKLPKSSIYEILIRLERHGFIKRDIGDNHIISLGRKYLKSNRIKTHQLFNKSHCAVCGRRDIIDIHHIDKNKENNKSSNLIDLCPNHHGLIHRGKAEIIIEKGIMFYMIRLKNKK